MKQNISLLLAILFIVAFSKNPVFAKIKLPAIFCDNMVLQQQTEAAIWGMANINSKVKVTTSWNGKSYSTKASSNGKWKLKVLTPKAGGPYEITISDGKGIKLKNVLVGEVWVCSGQSNMEMPLKGNKNQPVLGSSKAIMFSANPNIRLFTVKRDTSIIPLNDFHGDWKMCEPDNVAEFSATAYYFGSMLQKVLNVPVGLIHSSWGGTRIELWMSEKGVSSFPWVKLPEVRKHAYLYRQTPTVLYNAMIHPMIGFGMRGVIWYQGEKNRKEPKEYEKLLPGLINDWRTLWGIGNFPFYYVQISPYNYGLGEINSAFLREAQLNASTSLPNIGMISTIDIGEKDCIHPANKEIVGERLVRLALSNTYGLKGINGKSPVFKEMIIKDGLVKLYFDNAASGLTSFGKELNCFELASENRAFFPAKAIITTEGITLSSERVPDPTAVRYAFHDFVVGDLYGIDGLPVSSFRTDDWE